MSGYQRLTDHMSKQKLRKLICNVTEIWIEIGRKANAFSRSLGKPLKRRLKKIAISTISLSSASETSNSHFKFSGIDSDS